LTQSYDDTVSQCFIYPRGLLQKTQSRALASSLWRVRTAQMTLTETLRRQLPALIRSYVDATNDCNLEALLETFVDDALVNDQLRDYWGKNQIREWAARDIIGERLKMEVVNVVIHYGHIIVAAHVSGDFDKRGLPEPLVLAFYFSAVNEKIVQLIILRNQSGT
jgi:hypothetical protein